MKNRDMIYPVDCVTILKKLSELSEKEKTESIIDSMQFEDYIDFVKDIRSADWYVGKRMNEDGLEDNVYQYNYELNSKESAKKLFEYLLNNAAEGKDAFERKDKGDCSSAVYCASESYSGYDAFGYTNFIFLSGKTVVQMQNVWDEYQDEGVRYDHKPQKMLEGFGLVITEEIIEEKEDKKESSAKKVTFEEIEKAFKKSGYKVETGREEVTDEEASQGITYIGTMEGIRYYDDIYDDIYIVYAEFVDEDMALEWFDYILEEEYGGELKRTNQTSIAKAMYRSDTNEDYGETRIATCRGNAVVMLNSDWDEYFDAGIRFDHKPEKLFEELGI